MAHALAALVALAPLLLALLEAWQAKQPARRQKELETDYDRDIARTDAALQAGDPDALTRLFEQERRLGIRDRGLDPRGDAPRELRPDGDGPPGRSDDQPA